MILVTGASGFLGSSMVESLLEDGHDIRVIIRNPAAHTYSWLKIVDVIQGDINDIKILEKAVTGVDYVIHCAATVTFWKKRRKELMATNVKGTANLVDVCLEEGVEKLVHISSIAALGKTNDDGIVDEQSKWVKHKTTSGYAESKYRAELEVQRGVAEGLSAAIVNPGVILGPGANWDKGTPGIIKKVDEGLPFYVESISGLVGLKDVVKATKLVLNSSLSGGERFILVAENWPQKRLLDTLAGLLDKPKPTIKVPPLFLRIGGRMFELWGNLTNKEPFISLESARSASGGYEYDGSAIEELDFSYTAVDQVLSQTVSAYLKQKEG
ncbi:MAG: NAD-dependent epimerase/dehydratase family protein [Bacteroidota bacterium]